MLLGVAVLSFLCVVFRVPSFRWLLIEEKQLTAREERICMLFSGLNRNLAVVLLLLWVARGRWGADAYITAGALSLLLTMHFICALRK